MRSELSEADAKGSIAAIYAEVRELCAVPYVSSLHRHLASRPGWLEWAWAAIGPAFRSGLAQEAAWQVATDLRLRPDPGATPLALAMHSAITYYESLGQNWERAAMIKAPAAARVLAIRNMDVSARTDGSRARNWSGIATR